MKTTISKYTIDWFIKFFSAIPARKWTTGTYDDGKRRCAMGHLMKNAPEAAVSAIYNILDKGVIRLNDGDDPCFKQKTPRSRILAALRAARDSQ